MLPSSQSSSRIDVESFEKRFKKIQDKVMRMEERK